MKFLIMGGFLGSGKTSVILQLAQAILKEHQMEKIVILENEIGEIGIDDQVLQSAGYQVKGLLSGCVCCTMVGELNSSVQALQEELNPDWIIMEATGLAVPQSIQENLAQSLGIQSRICCLVDAHRWQKILKPLSNMLVHQLENADIILANKADLVDEATMKIVRDSISQFNSKAEVVPISTKEGIDQHTLALILGKEMQT